jgi:hypothetical protein
MLNVKYTGQLNKLHIKQNSVSHLTDINIFYFIFSVDFVGDSVG